LDSFKILSMNSSHFKEIVFVFLPLAFISFGGPTAHFGMLYDALVTKRHWVDSSAFSELLGICQTLPGPASTQMVYGLSICHAGIKAAIVAFLCWR